MDPRRERRLKLVKALEETIERTGYECVNIELTHEEGRSILRVTIDSPGGIGVADCENVSRALGGIQEEIDPFFKGSWKGPSGNWRTSSDSREARPGSNSGKTWMDSEISRGTSIPWTVKRLPLSRKKAFPLFSRLTRYERQTSSTRARVKKQA